jgi:short-subunit dehydrogenase
VTKHALNGFSRSLRQELVPHNIRVIGILPGPVYTSSWEGVSAPRERFIQAEDVAKMAWQAVDLPQATVVDDIIMRPMKGNLGPEEF